MSELSGKYKVGDMVYLISSRLRYFNYVRETFIQDSEIEIFYCKVLQVIPVVGKKMCYRLSYKDKELDFIYPEDKLEANIEDYKPMQEIGNLYQYELRLTLEKLVK